MHIDIDSDIDGYNDNAPRLEDGSSINLPMAVTKVFLKGHPKHVVLKPCCRGNFSMTAAPSCSASSRSLGYETAYKEREGFSPAYGITLFVSDGSFLGLHSAAAVDNKLWRNLWGKGF